MMLPFITFTGMSVASMAFELSSILIFLRGSSIAILLKEKYSLVNSEATAIMLGCFLHLTIAFKIGCSLFFDTS